MTYIIKLIFSGSNRCVTRFDNMQDKLMSPSTIPPFASIDVHLNASITKILRNYAFVTL